MKILQVAPRIPAPPNDGGAVYVYHMTRHLAARGHEMEMVAFHSNKHEQDPEMLKPYCHLHHVDGQFKPYTPWAVLKSTLVRQPIIIYHRMRRDLMGYLLNQVKIKPDIILLEGIHSAWFIEQLRNRYPNTPQILRQSNVEHLLLKRNGEQSTNPFIRIFYLDQAKLMHRFETRVMKQVDAVTAISQYDKQCYLEDIPDLQCYVNTAGSELPALMDIERDRNRVIAISNWRWKPNFDGLKWFLNNVWPNIIQQKPNLRIDIIGSGLDDSFIEQYEDESINFLGFVKDLEPHRQRASVLVAPLFSGSGMKLKIIESLASGLPVITTSVGAEGINLEDHKHYLHAESVQDFFQAIIELLENKNLCRKLSMEGRKLIESEYTWRQKASELEDILFKESSRFQNTNQG